MNLGNYLGMHLGQYKLLKKLGKGGYGSAYLAEKDNEKYVIKQIDKKRFKASEILILEKIERVGCQPDILCYVEGLKDPNYIYFVTKAFLNASELHDFLHKDSQITYNKKLQIMLNCATALSKLHDMGIAHVDIKSQNILMNPITLNIQIIDFGISCDENFLNKCYLGGTIVYHSPELLQAIIDKKNNKDSKLFRSFDDYKTNDVFSLGILFYEILYNNVPMDEFEGSLGFDYYKTLPLLLEHYKKQKIGKHLTYKTPINNLISKMLSFNKKKRPNMLQITTQLINIINENKKEKTTVKQVKTSVKEKSIKLQKSLKETKKLSSKQSYIVNKKNSNIEILDKMKPKTKLTRTFKICPEGKEFNPKTNRCVKSCKPGQIRNPKTNRCVKQKS